MRVAILAFAASLLSIASPAQTAASPAQTANVADPLDKIAFYSGTWKTQMEHFDTAFSKAGKEATVVRNDCWRSGTFYACNQFVDGDSKVLLVFTYSAKEDVYTSTQIALSGGSPGSGKLYIQGNTWTFPWQVEDNGKPVYFRVVNVWSSPTSIEFRSQFSRDNAQWTVMARGTEQKQP